MTNKNKSGGRLFTNSERGALIRIAIRKSNASNLQEKLPKLSFDIAMYLISRGRRNIVKEFFFSNLDSLASRVARFVGRKKLPTRGAMSAALSSLDKTGLYKYEIALPNNKAKHGESRGIKLTLIDQFE